MKSEELQELTGSEPLTLEQEKDMQKTWREDDDKCTFIVLNKKTLDDTGDEVSAMVGDTNLFISGEGNAEAEIMIAEQEARGKKMGWEAMMLMLRYGVEMLKIFNKLGFKEESRSEVFNEVTSALVVSSHVKQLIIDQAKWSIEIYNHHVK